MCMVMPPPLKYLIVYPFTPLTIAKCFNVATTVLIELSMSTREPPLLSSQFALTVSICNLVALLVTLISLWFTVQKFFLKKVDISLSISAFILYSISAICILLVPSRVEDTFADRYSILLVQGYLITSALFSSTWAYVHSIDVVSNLLIAHWGAATTDQEIESLLLHF
ncbi:hypothetical protein Tcan_14647 [Toxocara canis]|uniref:MARVEL domain-containing protein n=1 Tax=Toxocara canis TaxID=6265 RepID=A0A0B2V489_TOXCA|nr:hypothetical protein Tcan_14647 [Toxocara canis]